MAKTKSKPQSDNTKPSQTQNDASVDSASEKLHSLKSLNAMLLKETVERRQQVETLTNAISCLESELHKSESDNASLKSDFDGLTERAVKSEIEKGVVEEQVAEMAEVNRREKEEMLVKIGGLERDLKRVVEEKSAVERVKRDKEAEIDSLTRRLTVLEGEIGEEKFILSRVCEERDAIRAQIEDRVKIENELRLKLAEAEKRGTVSLESLRKIKADYDGLVKEKVSVERKVDSVLRDKDSIERKLIESFGLIDELKIDINRIGEEKMVLEQERDLLEKNKNQLQESVDGLNDSVCKLEQGKIDLVKEVVELRKKCAASSDKEVKMSAQIDVLVKEKHEIELSIEKLTQEKSLVQQELGEALKNLRNQNFTLNKLVKEKTEIDDAKNQAETNVMKLKQQLEEIKKTTKTLEKLGNVQSEKIKQLEAENKHHTAASGQATKEKNRLQVSLDSEKQKVKLLTENISKLETDIKDLQKKLSKMQKESEKLVAEKKDFENTRVVLENEILVVKKSLAKTQKEHDETKGKLRRSDADRSILLKLLKNTSSICNSKEDDNMGINQETEFGEEIKHHVTEVEAIKKAFKDKETVVDEMKKQLELLKARVAKADKGKSFWTMVSSATTMLAAFSLAYVAKGGY